MMKYQIPKEHYYQMYNKVFDLDLKATTFLVYSYLVCCAGNKGSCWPSMETISRKTGLSMGQVVFEATFQGKKINTSQHPYRMPSGIDGLFPGLKKCSLNTFLRKFCNVRRPLRVSFP